MVRSAHWSPRSRALGRSPACRPEICTGRVESPSRSSWLYVLRGSPPWLSTGFQRGAASRDEFGLGDHTDVAVERLELAVALGRVEPDTPVQLAKALRAQVVRAAIGFLEVIAAV